MSQSVKDVYIASLPPVAYDPQAPRLAIEAGAIDAVLGAAIDDADTVLREQDPAQAETSLPDWERNYSLPDPCAGLSSTVERRRVDLMHKITARGNLSAAFMVAIAARYGFEGATISEYSRITCTSQCTAQLIGANYQYVWRLNLPGAVAIQRMTCRSPCNSALRSWGNEALECAIGRAKPAGTRVLFSYST